MAMFPCILLQVCGNQISLLRPIGPAVKLKFLRVVRPVSQVMETSIAVVFLLSRLTVLLVQVAVRVFLCHSTTSFRDARLRPRWNRAPLNGSRKGVPLGATLCQRCYEAHCRAAKQNASFSLHDYVESTRPDNGSEHILSRHCGSVLCSIAESSIYSSRDDFSGFISYKPRPPE